MKGLYKFLYNKCYNSNEESNRKKGKNKSLSINQKRNMDLIKFSRMLLPTPKVLKVFFIKHASKEPLFKAR
jgi:hypothetical protein